MCRKLSLVFIALSLSLISQSKEYRFAHLTTANGISQSEVYTFLEDSNGFMWVGTVDGLNRYDGYSFKIFNTDKTIPHSLSNNTVRSLAEDKNERIWIGTDDGLNFYDQRKELIYKVKINKTDSVATASIKAGKKGRAVVILSASDGTKSVSDTVSLIVKDLFTLSDTLNDTLVKSGYSIIVVNKDIAHIFPVVDSGSSESYDFDVVSSDPALVRVEKGYSGRTIKMVVADSSFGSTDIIVSVIDRDQFSVKDTFRVDVNKSYSKKKYQRERVTVNPGIALFTGIDYSGAFVKLWIKDIFGIALGGYYHWDQLNAGAEADLLLKPALNFPLHPYFMVGVGYHHATVSSTVEDLNIRFEDDISMPVFRTAGGVDLWLGKSKHHVIVVEGGYTFGRKEYSATAYSMIGESKITYEKATYEMPPLHFRVSYSVFFRKL